MHEICPPSCKAALVCCFAVGETRDGDFYFGSLASVRNALDVAPEGKSKLHATTARSNPSASGTVASHESPTVVPGANQLLAILLRPEPARIVTSCQHAHQTHVYACRNIHMLNNVCVYIYVYTYLNIHVRTYVMLVEEHTQA